MNEFYVNECGEAIIGEMKQNDVLLMRDNNPFIRLSNDLIENWSPIILQNASKTWKSTLKSSNNSIDTKQKEELFLQDFLNVILPPIPTKITKTNDENINTLNIIQHENKENKEQTVYSLVSTKQVTRTELKQINNDFDNLIQQRRARKVGLDKIRLQLSFQLFDELIRQIAIDCKERALLLLRIRDQTKLTLQAYGILKTVASTFSINEAEKSDQGFDELIETKNNLLEKKKNLQNELLKLQNKMKDKEKEVKMLEELQLKELKQHKMTIENEANQLQTLIDIKKRKGSTRSRRKSIKQTLNKSTRSNSNRNTDMHFAFNT